MASVTLRNVSKIYEGGTRAVNGVDLEIQDREFMVLVGPSGCGKSTTLRMIAGLEEVSEGEVLIGDRVVNDVPPKDRDIAMVFQNYALYPHMTVFENLAFGLKLRRVPKAEIRARVEEVADSLGLSELLDRRPKALSGGQRQRVAVGRAIIRKPQVFLFDEPLSNLDAKMRVQMRTEIAMLHNRLRTTMIYVTHDQTEAMTLGDRICVMKDGFVQQVDAPLSIYDSPVNRFVAGFIGTPPTNFIPGTVSRGPAGAVFRAEGFSMPLPPGWAVPDGTSAVLGIRPEHIGLAGDAPSAAPVFEAQIRVVEPMGAETFLYLALPGLGEPVIARIPSHAPVREGHAVRLTADLSHAHLFSPGGPVLCGG